MISSLCNYIIQFNLDILSGLILILIGVLIINFDINMYLYVFLFFILFLIASPGASSAHLTVSEIFPSVKKKN